MATIYNSDLSKELQEGAKIQSSRDAVPNQLAEKVVPVMEVNPKLLRRIDIVKHAVQTTTGSMTVFTTPAENEFYISSAYVGFIKDAACDMATGSIQFATTIDGVARRLLDFPVITLTAQNTNQVIEFPIPIKLDKNVAITLSGTFTAGVMIRSVGITGYTALNPKA